MAARRIAGWTAAALLALPGAALAAPASPDPGYGSGGTAQPAFPGGAQPSAVGMTLDRAGRAVVAARTGATQLGLMRLAPNGATDFATLAPLGAGSDSLLTDVVEQSAGGYAVGGWVEQGDHDFAVARFTAAGQFAGATVDPRSGDDEIRALAVQGDGRIVAAGASGNLVGVARYAADGTLEFPRTLEYSGVTGEEASGVVVEPGGRIVVAGTGFVGAERRFLLAALTPSGEVDPSFGSGGLVMLDVGDGDPEVHALERQPDGKLLVAGTTDRSGAGGGVVARFLPNGTPDAGFSSDGIARVGGAGGVVEDIALQADGKVVAAGEAGVGTASEDSVVARFRPGGARDPGFGADGVLRRSLGGAGPDRLTGVGVSAGGGIVAAGLESSGAPSVVATRLVGGDSSDPALAMTAESLGDLVSFTLTATNPGADPARDVTVAVTPPPRVRASALATAGGACARMSCSLGTLPAGAIRRMTLLVRARRPGALSAGARIGTSTFDSNPGNNAASARATARRNRVVRRDRSKPKVRLRLRARRIGDVRRRVRLTITTSEAASVVVRTRSVKAGRAQTFARTRTIRLRSKGSKTARLALTRPARTLVRRKQTRRLELAVTVRARDRAGNKRTETLRKTLRRKPPAR